MKDSKQFKKAKKDPSVLYKSPDVVSVVYRCFRLTSGGVIFLV